MANIIVEHDKGRRFITWSGDYTVVTGKADGDPDEKNGMSPGALFIAALGACIGAYVLRFCDRHEIAHEGMTVVLEYENADSPSRVAVVNAALKLPHPVPEKYRKAILRVADQCYVTQR